MTRPPLRLINPEAVPELVQSPEPGHHTSFYPPELIELTDRLHDADHVELGMWILERYKRLVVAMEIGERVLEGETGLPHA